MAWQIMYFGWIGGELILAVVTRRRVESKQDHDRGTHLLLWVVSALCLTAAGFLQAMLPASFRWRAEWLRPTSLILMICGMAIRATAIFTLGRWFTVNVVTSPGQRLQQSGLYRFVRHPSYLGMEIIFLAIGLHSRDWPALLAAVVPPTLAVLYRIHIEEAALLQAFNGEYEEYCRRTKRLIPGLV